MTSPDIETVRVALGDRGYDIVVGPDLLTHAAEFVAPVLNGRNAVIVSDDNVALLHGGALQTGLARGGIDAPLLEIPPGEGTKCFAELEKLVERLLALPIERSTVLIALGGGMVGDLTGFAAAIALRGIDFIQVPTTLLAQVDSSVGGKTGINAGNGKNLVGAFHQPLLVLADLSALATLPRRERLAGYAEVVKYGLIGDIGFFEWLEANGRAVVDGDIAALRHAVAVSCRAKARIVADDEKERGSRALLNFGHTFGHALEAEYGYDGRLLHGEGVAIGMVLATALSAAMGEPITAADEARVASHLAELGLPASLAVLPDRNWDVERIIDHMGRDKKVSAGTIVFILLHALGDAYQARNVPVETLRALLTRLAAAA